MIAIACICASALLSAGFAAQPDPAGKPAATPPEAPEQTILDKVRAAYLAAPTIERLRVSVRLGDLPPRRSLLLVRLEPAADGQSIARAVIRAGRLLIDATPTQVRAMLDSPDSPVFQASPESGDVAIALAATFPPLPLVVLDFIRAGSSPPTTLTPYGASIVFESPSQRQRSGPAVLSGTMHGGTFRLTVDAASGRIRRLELVHGDPSVPSRLRTIIIEHAPSNADLSSIDQAAAGRDRVGSMSQLIAGEPQVELGTPFSPAAGSAADAAVRAAVRDTQGTPRFAIILLGGLPRPELARPDLSQLIATVSALCTEVEAFNAPSPTPDINARKLDVGSAVLWHGASEAEDTAIDRFAASTGGRTQVASIAGAEGEISRIAPHSAAAFLVLGPDLSIQAIHPVETLPADPEQRIAELLMSLLDAAARYETDPKEGP